VQIGVKPLPLPLQSKTLPAQREREHCSTWNNRAPSARGDIPGEGTSWKSSGGGWWKGWFRLQPKRSAGSRRSGNPASCGTRRVDTSRTIRILQTRDSSQRDVLARSWRSLLPSADKRLPRQRTRRSLNSGSSWRWQPNRHPRACWLYQRFSPIHKHFFSFSGNLWTFLGNLWIFNRLRRGHYQNVTHPGDVRPVLHTKPTRISTQPCTDQTKSQPRIPRIDTDQRQKTGWRCSTWNNPPLSRP